MLSRKKRSTRLLPTKIASKKSQKAGAGG